MTTATLNDVHQSKWGYHPASRETFLKLKAIKKEFHRQQARLGTFWRWARKMPHNRPEGQNPPRPTAFFVAVWRHPKDPGRNYVQDYDLGFFTPETGRLHRRPKLLPYIPCPVEGGQRVAFEKDGRRDLADVQRLYDECRMPQAEPPEAWNPVLIAAIDRAHARLVLGEQPTI